MASRTLLLVIFALQIVRMKSCHATALALVGWYLIVPPVYQTDDGNLLIGVGKALSDWTVAATYDSAVECQQDMTSMTSTARPQTKGPFMVRIPTEGLSKNDQQPIIELILRHAHCIAADDPRLKGN
jgi:hypothetical protein